MKIESLSVREISDSSGNPTIEVEIKTEKGLFSAAIPSGKSKGSREASVRTPVEAKELLDIFGKDIAGKDFPTVKSFDGFLIALDGTEDKSRLGGNLMLGLSLAFARGLAAESDLELWEELRREYFSFGFREAGTPRIFSNFIEGGVHAKNNLDIQEFWVVAEPRESVSQTVSRLSNFYNSIGETLKNNNSDFEIGDEDGYSLDFADNFGPIVFLEEELGKQGMTEGFSLGIDAAASSFYEKSFYRFDGKQISSRELANAYSDYFRKAPLLEFIEDPFEEKDEAAFVKFSADLAGKLVIGDDLTVTDPGLIEKAAGGKAISGVIIKPNQVGTVSETCAAINIAHEKGLKCIVSHRSGETTDPFLIHFAKAAGTYGVKIGAPVGSRLPRFEELVRLYS